MEDFDDFKFTRTDICDYKAIISLFQQNNINSIIHLAAQAGVRYSLENPFIYQQTNVLGTLNLLDLARKNDIMNFTFASSSSSVYGNQKETPFSEDDPVSHPISIYAATKQAGEALCYSYHHLYGMSIKCLRFFTVYGPSGRPDMSHHIFTDRILSNKHLKVFDCPSGTIERDYTYVSDIVDGICRAHNYENDFQIFNLGNGSPVKLMDFIHVLENITGKTADIDYYPRQPGDVDITYADISKARKLLGYKPEIDIEKGSEIFVEWFKDYYGK